jgi:hypothetical protein
LPELDRDSLLDDLSAYLDGELSQGRAAAVERLLTESPDARRTFAELRTVREQVRGLPRRRASMELGAALRGQVAPRALWSRRVLRLGVPLAAAAAAVLAVGVFLHHEAPPPAGPKTPQVALRTERASVQPAVQTPESSPRPAAAARDKDVAMGGPERIQEKLESLGWADATRAAETPAADQPASKQSGLAIVIHPRSAGEYARYAALLASWSPEASSATAEPSREYVYQLSLPDVSARVAQLLGVQTADEGTGDVEAVALAPLAVAPAGRASRAMEKKEENVAEKRTAPSVGRAGGAAGRGAPRSRITSKQRDEAARAERLHAQHKAVTEEPEVIVIDAPGPASAPTSPPITPQPQEVAKNGRLIDLLLTGVPPGGATSRRAGIRAATQASTRQQVELRIELRPAVATTTPASGPAK